MKKQNQLIAEALSQDPRIAEAKKLIVEAVSDHQKKIKTVQPPNPELKLKYSEIIKALTSARGQNLFFPYVGSGIGNGVLVELMDGSIKYDFISGIGPHYFGHSHLGVISESVNAAYSDTVMQGNLQQNIDPLALSSLLIKATGMPHCFLTTTGVMANENAFKIAFQKRFPANRILCFDKCFAGRSLAMSQLTDKAIYREGLPITYDVDYVPFYDPEHPEESTEKSVNALKKYLARYPKQHAVMCFEFIQGEGGFNVGTKDFFTRLMEILKEADIAIIADEVQSFGRTTELFAFQHFGLDKYIDIICFGKLSQVCGTLFTKEYNPKPGLLSQTFIGSTSALMAGKYMIESMLSNGYFGKNGKIARLHAYFEEKLEALSKKYPKIVRGPFGIGTMIAFTPFNGDNARTNELVQRLFEAGLMSFVAGLNPTRIRFLVPADVITHEDIDNAVNIIEKTLLDMS